MEQEKLAERLMSITKESRPILFASSWCLLGHESEAMWRLYCGANDGVAIVLPYDKLQSSVCISNTYAGMMNYIDYDADSILEGNPVKIAMHKRREFEYEHEARIICYRPEWRGTATPPAVPMPWDVEKLVEAIVVNPYAPAWYLDSIRELTSRVAPALAARVKESTMGGGPF